MINCVFGLSLNGSIRHVWLLRVKVCIFETISLCGEVSCPALNLELLVEANRY